MVSNGRILSGETKKSLYPTFSDHDRSSIYRFPAAMDPPKVTVAMWPWCAGGNVCDIVELVLIRVMITLNGRFRKVISRCFLCSAVGHSAK